MQQFFEGVQLKVAQGVKETEISYQMAFSKQELRKVIAQYPAREVKKGLENLYKKVEKHLSEEENLLQVVWHAMQEEFIAQYNYLEERIQKCYAGAMINLEFNIQDILAFFSDIARSHWSRDWNLKVRERFNRVLFLSAIVFKALFLLIAKYMARIFKQMWICECSKRPRERDRVVKNQRD